MAGAAEFEKEVWLSGVMLSWGSCGQLLTIDDEVAGFAVYAPPPVVTSARAFPTAPVSADAVLLMTATVLPPYRGQGHARFLIQAAAKHLAGRGVRAIEMFGHRGDSDDVGADDAIPPCLVPADFALAVGFTEVRPHHRYPRLRLELDTAIGWKAGVESALEQLFSVISIPVAPAAAQMTAVRVCS